MTGLSESVRDHYQAAIGDRSQLLARISGLVESLGDGPVTADRLAGLDQFHFGGLQCGSHTAGANPLIRVIIPIGRRGNKSIK